MNAILMINGIKQELEGKRDQSLANLKIYLSNPVGVGEHSDISSEVKALLTEVDKYDSILETINKYIQEDPQENPPKE
jgi:hypothetical protein